MKKMLIVLFSLLTACQGKLDPQAEPLTIPKDHLKGPEPSKETPKKEDSDKKVSKKSE